MCDVCECCLVLCFVAASVRICSGSWKPRAKEPKLRITTIRRDLCVVKEPKLRITTIRRDLCVMCVSVVLCCVLLLLLCGYVRGLSYLGERTEA